MCCPHYIASLKSLPWLIRWLAGQGKLLKPHCNMEIACVNSVCKCGLKFEKNLRKQKFFVTLISITQPFLVASIVMIDFTIHGSNSSHKVEPKIFIIC